MERHLVLMDGKLNSFKKAVFPTLIDRLNTIPMKISAAIFAEIYT